MFRKIGDIISCILISMKHLNLGLDIQKQEIKESIELPLSHPELYYKLGIDPPSGKHLLL